MSLALGELTSSPHLLPNRSATWPRSYNTHEYPLKSSPASMSPQPAHPFVPRMTQSPISSQDISDVPTPAWYGPPASDPNAYSTSSHVREAAYDVLAQPSYAPFRHFVPPYTSSTVLAQPAHAFLRAESARFPPTQHDLPRPISPASAYSHNSLNCDSTRESEEPQLYSNPKTVTHFESQRHYPDLPNSRVDISHSVPVPWPVNSLDINTPAMRSDPYQTIYPPFFQTPSLGSSARKLSSSHLISPQPRRVFTPIAPQLAEATREFRTKRPREEAEVIQESKRRRRSDSNASAQPELSDEDKLLLKLKEEDSIPWKDIAARFQVELGKTYQIPALQMRLKRLREKMRAWNEVDIKALRMAHDFWTQNKFEIISQKMLDFGVQERWPARQCARKWAEIESLQKQHAYPEERLQHAFGLSMSPDEPPHQFLPYQHAP